MSVSKCVCRERMQEKARGMGGGKGSIRQVKEEERKKGKEGRKSQPRSLNCCYLLPHHIRSWPHFNQETMSHPTCQHLSAITKALHTECVSHSLMLPQQAGQYITQNRA